MTVQICDYFFLAANSSMTATFLLQGWTPRGKTGCPAPQKAGLAPPRPAKLTKSAGRSGAKLTADFIDTPFYYARD